jgi:hypothetical protein
MKTKVEKQFYPFVGLVAGAKGALRPSNHAQGHLKTVWFWHDLNP